MLQVLLLVCLSILATMVLTAIFKSERFILIEPYLVEILQAVTVVKADLRLLEIHFSCQVMIAKATLQALHAIVAKGTSHLITADNVVYHRTCIAITQARVFLEFNTYNLFRQQGGDFLLCSFSPIDTELHTATVGHAYTTIYAIDTKPGQHQMTQHIYSIIGCTDLFFTGKYQFLVCPAHPAGSGDSYFTQLLRSVCQS